MVSVKICVGSSCHIRGGARTLKTIKALIEQNCLTSEIKLSADLCLDNCLQAPNVVVDEQVYGGITPDRAEDFFQSTIMPRVNANVSAGNNINQ